MRKWVVERQVAEVQRAQAGRGGGDPGNLRNLAASEFIYRFRGIECCNMCAASVDSARVVGRRLNTQQGARPTRTPGIATTVMQCRCCGLMFSNPMPIPLDVAQHYGKPPEDYWRSEYFEIDPEYFDPQIDRFYDLWRGEGRPAALDIGAGLGKAMLSLERRGFEAFGLEPSEPFFQRAIERTGIDPTRLQLSTLEEAEYPPDRFDFVTFGAVLEHLYDPAGSIERALSWTAPGGLIHVDVPSAKWLTSRLANLAYRLQGLDYAANISPMHVPYHLHEFTLGAFRQHARRAGYRVVGKRSYVGRTFLPGPLDGIGAWIMRRTGTGMQLEVWLGK